jgi:hypothetical protein
MTSPKLQDILSWANLTSELFGISRDKALEAAVDWQAEHQEPDVPDRTLEELLAETARGGMRRLGIGDGMTLNERRRAMLDIVKSRAPSRLENVQVAEAAFVLGDLSPKDRRRIIKAVREDLEYWSGMNILRKEGREFWFPIADGNGAAQESSLQPTA